MNDLRDAYPEMYLATAQDRIRKIELNRRRALWRAELKHSRRSRGRRTRPVEAGAPSTSG